MRVLRGAGLLLILILAASGVLAQDFDLDKTFEGKITFQYPSDWEAEEQENGVFIIGTTRETGLVSMLLYYPDVIDPLIRSRSDLAKALDSFLADNFDYITSDAEIFEITDDRSLAAASIDVKDSELGGFAFLVELGGDNLGFVTALSDPDKIEDSIPLFLAIVRTYEAGDGSGSIFNQLPGGNEEGDKAGEPPNTLDSFNRGWEAATAELREAGVIGDGGGLVVEEDSAYFDGIGSWYTGLGTGRPFTDVVMAGDVSFTIGSTSEYESCGMMARTQASRRGATIYLEVGMNNEGRTYYVDSKSDGEFDGLYLSEDLDTSVPHHFLLIAQKDKLMVYLDGELLAQDLPIENRSGTYGVALLGKGRSSRCEVTNLWVYQAPFVEEGVCVITAKSNVNKRSGPGTSFAQAGQLRSGAALDAIGFANDSGGRRWWKLQDDTWVREDVVTAAGDCSDLPEES